MDCSLPGSSVHGISQTRILEWIAISFSMGSSWPRNGTCISCTGRQLLYCWATRGAWYCWYWHKISNKDTLTMWLLNWWTMELSWVFPFIFKTTTLFHVPQTQALRAGPLQCTLRSQRLSSMFRQFPGIGDTVFFLAHSDHSDICFVPAKRVMFQSAAFLGFGKSCSLFLNYKLMIQIAAFSDLTWAQKIGFVKSKRVGKQSQYFRVHDNLWLTFVVPKISVKRKAEGPRRKGFLIHLE